MSDQTPQHAALESAIKAFVREDADASDIVGEHPAVTAWVLGIEVQTLHDGEPTWTNIRTTSHETSPKTDGGVAEWLASRLSTSAWNGQEGDDE